LDVCHEYRYPTAIWKQYSEAAYGLSDFLGGFIMGKYLLAWFLGVPAIVLVIVYLFL